MAALTFYLQNAAAPYTPTTKRGAWDDPSSAYIMGLGAKAGAAGGNIGKAFTSTAANYDTLVSRFVSSPLAANSFFTGPIEGVVGIAETNTAIPAYLHLHVFALVGQTNTLRGTLWNDYIDPDEAAAALATGGESFSGTVTDLLAYAGDTIVVELGARGRDTAISYIAYTSCGSTDATDLTDGASASTYPGWIRLAYTVVVAPTVTTTAITAITSTTATSGGNVTADGGATVTDRGVCWNTGGTPTTANSHTHDGSGTGSYASSLTGLSAGTTYHVRAYATNSVGTGYGSEVDFVAALIVVGNAVQVLWNTQKVVGAEVQVLWDVACPVASLVTPLDGGILQGLTPTSVFGTYNYDGDPVHVEFQVSAFFDFRSYEIDTNSVTDFANWEESATPFTTWTDMVAGGATAGNRIRYATLNPLRYDIYYGRVRLTDLTHPVTGAWTYFSFTISIDATAPLVVTIGGTTFSVGVCNIIEDTDGEASPIVLEIPLSAFLAHPLTESDPIAISSGLGGWNRSWNGTVENWVFKGDLVSILALQDDSYLSRKMCTGNVGAADLGHNLWHLVDSYGTPLTGSAIDEATGATMALVGGYKYLREHFADALKVLPNFLYWVDSTGDVHLVDQDSLPLSPIELYEEDPTP